MFKKSFLIVVAVMLFGFVSKAQCGWINGQDNSNPTDPGRGVTNWQDHYNYAKNATDLTISAGFIGARFVALRSCLELDNYAKVYADVSIKIADYGIKHAGWVNSGSNTLTNDGGCGILDWNAHYNHVKTNGYGNVDELVKNRMLSLSNRIPKNQYAKLYADVSVIIAKIGTTK